MFYLDVKSTLIFDKKNTLYIIKEVKVNDKVIV